MSAGKLFKAYLWLEIGAMAYLLFRKKDPEAPEGSVDQVIEDVTKTVKEKIDATSNP